MDQREKAIPLDANAAAGMLGEIFAFDATSATLTCGHCAILEQVGAIRLYGQSMGAVLRCNHCDNVLLRVVRTPAGLWFEMQGTRSLKVRHQEPA